MTPLSPPRLCRMLVHADDRGLQLGWSVFDTCNVEHGSIYALDFHIDRFFHSMQVPPCLLDRSHLQSNHLAAHQAEPSLSINSGVCSWRGSTPR